MTSSENDDLLLLIISRDYSYNKGRKYFRKRNQKFIRKETYLALKRRFKDLPVSSRKFSTKKSVKYKKIIKKLRKPVPPPSQILFRSLKIYYNVYIFKDSDPSSSRSYRKFWNKSLMFGENLSYDQGVRRYNNFRILIESSIYDLDYVKSYDFVAAFLYTLDGDKIQIG